MTRHEINACVAENAVFYAGLWHAAHIIIRDMSLYYGVESGCNLSISEVGNPYTELTTFTSLKGG